MDITGAVENGLISALFGLTVGFFGLILTRKALVRMMVNEATAYLTSEEVTGQLRGLFEQELQNYVTQCLKYLHEHPDKVAPVLNGFVTDLAKAIPKEAVANAVSGAVASGVAGELAGDSGILQYVPRKWRGPLAIVQMFMGGGKNTAKSEETAKATPFG